MILTLVLGGVALPAAAQMCPAPRDDSAATRQLHLQMQAAQSAPEAQALNGQLWQVWTRAPDAQAQALLDEGMGRIRSFDLLGAVEVLDQLVAYCPAYAEGWNQRAFAHYLRQDYAPALADLDRALAILPTHTGALSGKALTLMGMGRAELAQEVLRGAVMLNPWLPERAMLVRPLGEEL